MSYFPGLTNIAPENMVSQKESIWVFPKIGVPQNGWFMMENPIKMDGLGVPLFSETSIYIYILYIYIIFQPSIFKEAMSFFFLCDQLMCLGPEISIYKWLL